MHLSTKQSTGDWYPRNLIVLFFLSVFAFLIMGYHPGLEDDVYYLSAIKKDLNPALFPYDSDFITVQFHATIFDRLIALSVRLTHLPLAWMVLLWQITAIFFILHACWRIACRLFPDPAAQWAAVTMIAALLTLPVSGSGINLADQHLHPRTLATAAILAAVVEVLDSRKKDSRSDTRRIWCAGFFLALAFVIHAIMAAFGISFCAFLWWTLRRESFESPREPPLIHSSSVFALYPLWCQRFFATTPATLLTALPLGWLFEPATDAWRKAASMHDFYYLSRWEWYEWLGVFAPLVLLFAYQRFLARREHDDATTLRSFVSALLYYGLFQTAAAIAVMLPQSLERIRPLEPMRYLHILYLFFFLLIGALLGRYMLRRHLYRWALLFIPLAVGMFYAQRQLYPASAHIEWPGVAPRNPWLQAFDWIRHNTPEDALFAIGPRYMTLPGEDYHGFRALAERSSLVDFDKDGGMAARVPHLAPRWLKELAAQDGWQNFQPQDFERLHHDFGVTWIVLSPRDAQYASAQSGSNPALTCPYKKEIVVCRLD
jgi:hypothetical protein